MMERSVGFVLQMKSGAQKSSLYQTLVLPVEQCLLYTFLWRNREYNGTVDRFSNYQLIHLVRKNPHSTADKPRFLG